MTEHTYPSRYAPGMGAPEIDEAWEILDQIPPGIIPDDTRFLLSGMIAGTLMRVKAEHKRASADMRAAARSLINGIDTGLVTVDSPADETLANTMRDLRAAITKVEGRAP